ncbi:MAG: oligomeric, coiled-coil, peripheral membrane protein [Thelocarpon impressellum]|nr:MAG: oligomeric, coiled-coil, peripheral membrane protein [Thelocarpon impressellum]
MSLHVYIAHTGHRLRADPVSFGSLDALRAWIARSVPIAVGNQILMTTRGKQVKLQTLLTETELFVFDRVFIAPAPSAAKPVVPQLSLPPPAKLDDPPDILSSQTDLQAWQTLFRLRRSWALDLVDKCSAMGDAIARHAGEVSIIERAVGVAIANLETHVRGLEQKRNDATAWAGDLLQEQESTIRAWEATSTTLQKIPVKPAFLRFVSLQGAIKAVDNTPIRDSSSTINADPASLRDLIRFDDVDRAARLSREISQGLSERVAELGGVVDDVVARSQELARKVLKAASVSTAELGGDSQRLLEDLEIVAKKVSSDYDHVLGLPNASKSVSQASKMALLHTRNYLPSLKESGADIAALQRRAVEQRNAASNSAVHKLQTVSTIESILADVSPRLSALEIAQDGLAAFDLLSTACRLPVIYGSLLVEATRRREWTEKIKTDSSSLAEELAIYKEEEERRRKKWQRGVGAAITTDLPEAKALGVEVNLQGDEQPWPNVQRTEVDEYVRTLRGLDGLEGAVKEVSSLVKELDRPTRQQSKRAKAFKHGSMHDVALGRSSLLLRGDDESVRSLRDDKSKLEDRLKGSESRVRKLEDLLHRQSHMSRTAGTNAFQSALGHGHDQQSVMSPIQGPPMSPRPQDSLSRRSSVSSRRFSANQSNEERVLVQRIVSLEAELMAERERAAGFQREVAARRETVKQMEDRNEEAMSTKRDLMDNLEAQQRDFIEERKALEGEIGRLNVKVDEVEDELDRVLGSRDNAREVTKQRVQRVEEELRQAQENAAKEMDDLHVTAEVLRLDLAEQHERRGFSERQAQDFSEENARLVERVESLDAQAKEGFRSRAAAEEGLEDAHLRLAPTQELPLGLLALAAAIKDRVERSTEAQRDQLHQLEVATADGVALRTKFDGVVKDLARVNEQLREEMKESLALRDALADEKSRRSALQADVDEERAKLAALRLRVAEGSTGAEVSDGHREGVAAEVSSLTAELAAKATQIHALEEEKRTLESTHQDAVDAGRRSSATLESRTLRAKDITQRLYAQNDRLSRLLEQLGFIVTRRDDQMNIQRASKGASASTTEADPSSGLTGSIPTRKALEESGDLELLYWMQSEDPDAESSKYAAYLSAVGRFDVDAFSEAIVRRVKETEHMARKWQKDSRAYREKSHRFQLEAHEKIAFRSFKEGDLALFLPTRNQATRPWAAFNVGAPHYFLREQDSHKLRTRDWLLARISKVEERVVDLSRSMNGLQPAAADRRSIGESSDGGTSFEDENPFELSDGLRWYLLDAAEEKPGAPSTPGLGKSTVASAHVDARGSIRMKKPASGSGATRTLSKSLDSRRSSANSKGVAGSAAAGVATSPPNAEASSATSAEPLSQGPSSATAAPDAASTLAAAAAAATATPQHDHERSDVGPATATPTSPPPPRMEKRTSVLWDSLWSVDVSMESGKTRK